jgi:hypothetical protein
MGWCDDTNTLLVTKYSRPVYISYIQNYEKGEFYHLLDLPVYDYKIVNHDRLIDKINEINDRRGRFNIYIKELQSYYGYISIKSIIDHRCFEIDVGYCHELSYKNFLNENPYFKLNFQEFIKNIKENDLG